jgi:hypothetical protein
VELPVKKGTLNNLVFSLVRDPMRPTALQKIESGSFLLDEVVVEVRE